MGLFGGGNSKTSVSNQYETNTFTEQTDKSGNQGFQDIGGNLSISSVSNSVDADTIEVAGKIAGAGLSNAQAANAGALNFGATALNQVAGVNNNSISLLSGLVSGLIDNSKTLARDSIAASKQATADAVSGFGSLAKQSSASADDRVSKVALYAFAALAAVFVLPALFKGGGKSVIT